MRLKHQGSALISALFIMTLVAIAATAMSSRLQLDIYQARMNIIKDKLYLASELVTFWAMDQLLQKKESILALKNSNGKVMNFPTTYAEIYPNVRIQGEVIDLQAFFNINNLQNSSYQITFLQLLKNNLKKLNDEEYKHILSATQNWLIKARTNTIRDEFLDQYIKHKPPYLPAYQLMKNKSELRMVNGISHTIYLALAPWITALPEVTPLNLNTANKKNLMLLGQGLTEAQASELMNARGQNGIKDFQAIQALLQKLDISKEQISFESQYFLSVATVTHQDLQLTNISLLKREKNKKGKITVQILSEVLS